MTREKIGKSIKKKRERLNMSYYKLAMLSSCTIQQIHAVEDSSKSYTIDSLLKIGAALDLKIEIN